MEGQVFTCYPFLDAFGTLAPNLKFRAHQLLSGFSEWCFTHGNKPPLVCM